MKGQEGTTRERRRLKVSRRLDMFYLAIVLYGITLTTQVHAFDWVVEGNVTVLEASYIPGAVVFQMNAGAGSCPAGTWLLWENPSGDNNKAVYSGLLSALLSGRRIRFHGFNAGCKGQYIHLLP